MPIVYQATNLINGKRYIGITVETLGKRKAKHWYDANRLKRHSKFPRALRKHGIDAFRFSILMECADLESLKQNEVRLIALLRPEYNSTRGGDGNWGYKPTAETIEKIASKRRGQPAHNKGGKHTAEAKAKMREWHANNLWQPRLGKRSPGSGFKGAATRAQRDTVSHYWLGKKRSEETIKKIVETKASRPKVSPTPYVMDLNRQRFRILGLAKSKPVRCIEDGQTFPSAKAAALHYGIDKTGVNEVARGRRSHAHGLKFEWVDQNAD